MENNINNIIFVKYINEIPQNFIEFNSFTFKKNMSSDSYYNNYTIF